MIRAGKHVELHRYAGLHDFPNRLCNGIRQESVAIDKGAVNVKCDQAWTPGLIS